MCVESIMFSLIRSEITGIAQEEGIKKMLTPAMCQRLGTLASKHDVAHLVAAALSKNGLLGDDDVSQKFNSKLMMAVYRDTQKEYSLQQLTEVLQNAQIPFVLLKGAVIRNYYPETWMRTSCDIDVLVRESDSDLAVDSLCDAGFIRTADRSEHDYNLYSPNKTHIELHYKLSQESLKIADNILNEVWNHATPICKGSYQYIMTPEYFILYHIAHMARHIMHGGCGIRPFIDLWLLENKMSYDKEILSSLLVKTGLSEVYAQALSLSNVWLENAPTSEQTKLLSEYILSGGVYGTTKNAAQIKAAKGESKGRSFLNLMFLSKEALAVLYPNLKKHPRLSWFYQIKRWFRVFKKDKRDKIKHMTRQRNSVSGESAQSMQNLLEQLGLLEKI